MNGKHRRTFGQKAAEVLTSWAGSWPFILFLISILIAWAIFNTYAIIGFRWDPYPFILLNLFLSMMAAFQAPIILMSQNRAAEQDRIKAAKDLTVDEKAESEIRDMQTDLEQIKKKIDVLTTLLETKK